MIRFARCRRLIGTGPRFPFLIVELGLRSAPRTIVVFTPLRIAPVPVGIEREQPDHYESDRNSAAEDPPAIGRQERQEARHGP